MSNRLFTIIILLVAIFAGYFYLAEQYPDLNISRLTSKVAEEVFDGPTGDQGKAPPKFSVYNSLNTSTSVGVSLYPENFNPLFDGINSFKNSLINSNVGKKFQLDALLGDFDLDKNAAPDAAADEMANMAAMAGIASGDPFETLQSLPQILALLKPYWSALKEVSLVLMSTPIKIDNQTSLPSPLISLQFADKTAAQDVFKKSIGSVIGSKVPLPIGVLAIDQDPQDESLVHLEMADLSLSGFVSAKDSSFQIGLGAKSPADFENGDAFVSSSGWKSASSSFSDSSAVFGFADFNKLGAFSSSFDGLFSMAGGASPEGADFKQLVLGNIGAMTDFSQSVSFRKGVTTKQCASMPSDSKLNSEFAKYYSEISQQSSSGTSPFGALISDKSFLAVRGSMALIRVKIDSILDYYKQVGSAASSNPQSKDWAAFIASLSEINSALNRLPFGEIGLVVDPSPLAFMPEAGFFAEVPAGTKLADIESSLNNLFGAIAAKSPDFPKPDIKIEAAPDGKESLQVMIEPPFALSGRIYKDRYFILALGDEFANRLERASGSSQSYLEVALKDNASLAAVLPASDFYYYINTGSLLDMAKPWVSMFAPQQPGMELSQQDIDDVVRLLSTRLIMVSISSPQPSGGYCVAAKLVGF